MDLNFYLAQITAVLAWLFLIISYWKNKDKLIGKVITISYFEVTKNKQGDYGFRFGTWKGKEYIRFDKTDIDDTNIE